MSLPRVSVCPATCSASQGTSGEGLGGFHTLGGWNFSLMKASTKNRSQESSASAALQQTLGTGSLVPHNGDT